MVLGPAGMDHSVFCDTMEAVPAGAAAGHPPVITGDSPRVAVSVGDGGLWSTAAQLRLLNDAFLPGGALPAPVRALVAEPGRLADGSVVQYAPGMQYAWGIRVNERHGQRGRTRRVLALATGRLIAHLQAAGEHGPCLRFSSRCAGLSRAERVFLAASIIFWSWKGFRFKVGTRCDAGRRHEVCAGQDRPSRPCPAHPSGAGPRFSSAAFPGAAIARRTPSFPD